MTINFTQSSEEENNCRYLQILFTEDGMMTPKEFAAGKHPGSPPLSIKKAFEFYDKRDKAENNILDGSCVNAFFKGLDTNSKYDSFQTRPMDTKPKCMNKFKEQ